MIDDKRVGGSRLWLLSVGAAAGVLQVTGAPDDEKLCSFSSSSSSLYLVEKEPSENEKM